MSKIIKAITEGYVDWKNSKDCTNKKEAKKKDVRESRAKEAKKNE